MLKTPFTITFEITNSSKMTLYYSWDFGMTPEIISRNMYTITMQQKQNCVASESRSNCCLIITALQKTIIKNHPIFLKVLFLFKYSIQCIFVKDAKEKMLYI